MPSADVRVDHDPLDPEWPAPSPDSAAVTRPPDPTETRPAEAPAIAGIRRGPLVVGVGLLVLLLLGVGLWVAGAFRDRTDRGWPTAAGTTISAGPYELRFTKVTVQKKKDYNDAIVYETRVFATGRTTGDEAIEPSSGGGAGMFVLRDERTKAVYEPDGLRWGTDNRIGDGSGFTPGLPAVPFVIQFELPDSYVPAPTLTFAAFDQELRDNSLLGDQKPGWRNAYHFYRYTLPVQVLPDDLS